MTEAELTAIEKRHTPNEDDAALLVAEVRRLRAERTLLVQLALNVSAARTKAEVQRVMVEHRKAVAALQEEAPND